MQKISFTDKILDVFDYFKYEVFKKEIPVVNLPKKLVMDGGYDKENKTYWLECKGLPGFTATASSQKKLLKEVYETLLIYFDIPRYLARRMNNYGELVMPDGKRIKMVDTNIVLNYAD